jgi:curved DNA-binding protein CbpA
VAPPAPRPKTPWEVLEVPENATDDEVQSAYRKKVAQYHPDRVAHLPSEFQELAHQKLLELNAARERLKKLA